MSWEASAWMDSLPYDNELMKPLATRVLLKLANVAGKDGSAAWRNKHEVARELGVDQRSVQRALRELESAHLILISPNQNAVAHLRAGYRPTVYNLNFGWHREYSQPELELPEAGETELSTAVSGETAEETTEVPLGTKELSITTYQESPYVSNRVQAHETDASGAPTAPLTRWPSGDRCPGDWKHYTHQLGSSGACVHCFERPTVGART